MRRVAVGLVLAAIFMTGASAADNQVDDHVVIQTDWRAEAEHGGLYQALATGIFKKYHIDAEIHQGGPSLNQAQILVAGRADFSIQSNSFEPLNFVKGNIPIVIVAAEFQKDPQVLIAHPGAGNDTLEAMRGKPILISAASHDNFWQFLRLRYGFSDDQLRPYNFNMAPFLANQNAIQQGYLTSEPYAIELKTGVKPVTILLADQGYSGYAAMLATTRKMIAAKPDLVQRVVDAVGEGWKSYLTGDPSPANALIKRENPDMNDAIIAHAIAGMKERGMVLSGEALTQGPGAMTDARWQNFFDFTTEAGIYPKDLDFHRAYTLQFVTHHGTTGP